MKTTVHFFLNSFCEMNDVFEEIRYNKINWKNIFSKYFLKIKNNKKGDSIDQNVSKIPLKIQKCWKCIIYLNDLTRAFFLKVCLDVLGDCKNNFLSIQTFDYESFLFFWLIKFERLRSK